MWAKSYEGQGGCGDDEALDVAVSPDGSMVYVTGFSQGSTTIYVYATVAYSTS